MYSAIDITQPKAEPVTLAMAKQHLRVDFDDDDALIDTLIVAAREYVEKITRRALYERTVLLSLDSFPLQWSETLNPIQTNRVVPQYWEHFEIRLPKPKVTAILSITYQDEAGNTITLDPSTYRSDLNSTPARVVPAPGAAWPYVATYVPGSVQVTYTAGSYGDGETVDNCPASIKQAMLLLISGWYSNRDSVSPLTMKTVPFAVDALLTLHKVCVLGIH